MSASTTTPSNHRHGWDFAVRSALAGGFAGAAAKTAVAPLERVKILFQTQNADFQRFSGSWRGVGNALVYIWRTRGIMGLYQGHTLTLARSIPHAAISYTVYEKAKRILMPTPEFQSSLRRFLAGSITGLFALPTTYPFELIRVRMAIDTKANCQPSVRNAISTIWSEGRWTSSNPLPPTPLLNFYRGFPLTVMAAIPYRGGLFLAWETLNAKSVEILGEETVQANRMTVHLAIGAVAASIGEVFIYPLGVIRRTQQASGVEFPERMLGFRETTRQVWTKAGWRGFYAGMGIGLVKQIPLHSISLTSWQLAKRVLDV
ncbi:mitochondrial carrier [Agrocybe pediades]|nr:mitochondrial carrier [Agrocybe pediades]